MVLAVLVLGLCGFGDFVDFGGFGFGSVRFWFWWFWFWVCAVLVLVVLAVLVLGLCGFGFGDFDFGSVWFWFRWFGFGFVWLGCLFLFVVTNPSTLYFSKNWARLFPVNLVLEKVETNQFWLGDVWMWMRQVMFGRLGLYEFHLA